MASITAYGKSYYTLQKDETFTNNHCEKTNSCDLKTFRLKISDVKVTGSFGTSFTTQAYMSYTTVDIESLLSYGIVQFIKGCQWNSSENGDINFQISRNYYGGITQFKHPEFVIDSFDKDPMYSSTIPSKPHQTRHDIYRWNKIKDSFDEKSEFRFYNGGLTNARLYTRDFIGTVNYDEKIKSATNSSLEFLTCIYKIEDIPSDAGPKDIDPQNAIKCLTWSNSFIFNHQSKQFIKLKKVSDICKR